MYEGIARSRPDALQISGRAGMIQLYMNSVDGKKPQRISRREPLHGWEGGGKKAAGHPGAGSESCTAGGRYPHKRG